MFYILSEIGILMQEELYTIQLTRRELGLLKHYSHLLFANIDDDVTSDGQSCTGSFPIEKDWFGKDAITNLYRKPKLLQTLIIIMMRNYD